MGIVGATLRALLWAALGVASLGIPVALALGGLRAGEWLSRERSVRLLLLVVGLTFLLPLALHVSGADTSNSGWLGQYLGTPVLEAFGWFGATLVLAVIAVLLSIATLGWNPLRPVGKGMVGGGGALSRATRHTVLGFRRWKESRSSGSGPGRGHEGLPEEEVAEVLTASSHSEPLTGRLEGPASTLRIPVDTPELLESELPPISLLTLSAGSYRADMERDLDRLGEVLVEKLRTFSVECEIGGRTTGPVVTQFEVIPAPGVKVNRIANLDADLALAMKAQSIRIVAPIPGKGAVGVEIPNPRSEVVELRGMLEARAFRTSRAPLPLALGEDLTGRPYVADLSKMPHVLIAGATGSGKSVCLNTMITSLVYRHTPETVRLLLIDPKMVELSTYADLPHLRHRVVTDPRDAAGALKWAILEMEYRYKLFHVNGVRSIAELNDRVRQGLPVRRVDPIGPEGAPDRWIYEEGVLPYIVLVVDELADLMMTVQAEVEKPLTLLAQKARAIGIHLVVATQRPSVNVVTGLIKANFPCRIAFRVASKVDSRTIIDQNGADALLGNGDMLFLPPGHSEPIRIQGAFISTEDTDRLMAWYRSKRETRVAEGAGAHVASHEEDILAVVRALEAREALEATGADQGIADRDDLFLAAAEVCIQHQQGSTSLLQRRLKIGYGRAARIVDQLHEAGVLGPPDGSKPREVLVGLDELDTLVAREKT
jgi:S-DNA-T family DNA segregation ATPase FtsK/SpoIIIE